MDSALVSVGLPAALAIIVFGLGLALTPDDFARVARHPRAVLIILGTQILLLPLLGFAIAEVFGRAPELAVGLLLLAASPGERPRTCSATSSAAMSPSTSPSPPSTPWSP